MTVQEKHNLDLKAPKWHTCPVCSHRAYIGAGERHNTEECMMSNGVGIWALTHCPNCGYVEKLYPAYINGTKCTEDEAENIYYTLKGLKDE